MILARGTHFSVLGHSALRQPDDGSDSTKLQKRLELMPEETLYLMERGSLFCWRKTEAPVSLISSSEDFSNLEDCDLNNGAPMTVQQGFAEMIETDGLTLPHYIVGTTIPFVYLISLMDLLDLCIFKTSWLYDQQIICARRYPSLSSPASKQCVPPDP